MSESVKNSPGRPRSVQSHQAILKATLDLLGEVGYERMSIEAIAARAGVGKPTIYRRYSSKEELVADAIENSREEILIPDTGTLWGDLELIIESAGRTTLTPLGRQIKSLIISTASSNPQFAQVYWSKYLQPRRQGFRVVIERAKMRNEIQAETDSDLIFDLMSGAMLYAQIFPPTSEPWEEYIHRALELFLKSNLNT
ncbi:TetR/AcrR family transcriptional regulator [Nostoc sp.]|uniref:TetR/AcrR family transcriptional regulator n=1 Tax=Nostoc sp. TaxID=1180 RepID=UPI002FFCE32D